MYLHVAVCLLLAFATLGCNQAPLQELKPSEIPPQTPTAATAAGDTALYYFATRPSWAEEFNYTGVPVNAKWGFDIGNSGWGNNERQFYTNRPTNAFVENGQLAITARKENYQGSGYTSARLVTNYRAQFLYGRIEARIKLPAGRGTWPAFWTLPAVNYYGNWPTSGEIDVVEHVGYNPNVVHMTTHYGAFFGATAKSATKVVPTATAEFHLYRMDWTPDYLRGYVDNQKVYEYINPKTSVYFWPFNIPHYLILNVAVGGNWGGARGIDDTVFPATMYVDYVRVYKMQKRLFRHPNDLPF